jgi:hypothetical protein
MSLALVLALALNVSDLARSATARSADDLYPATPTREVLRFYGLGTDAPKLSEASAALAELGASVVYGPRTSQQRPKTCFLVLRAPLAAADRDLAKALRRAGTGVRALGVTAFDGLTPPNTIGGESLDEALMMFSAVAWIDCGGTRTQTYQERGPSAKEAGAMAEHYEMMAEKNMRLGQVGRDRFTWKLARVPDDVTASRITKAIQKLEGVLEVTLDGANLSATVELRALSVSGLGPALPDAQSTGSIDKESRSPPRATWCTAPLYDLLASEALLPPEAAAETK